MSLPIQRFKTAPTVAAAFLAAATLVAMAMRARVGVNFTDESYWIVSMLKFARGDIPFADEAFAQQPAFFIGAPLMKAFLWATQGSQDGVVLYSRGVYLVINLGLACLLYHLLKLRGWPTRNALMLATIIVAVVPDGIAGLSYNNVAVLAFTTALFAGYAVSGLPPDEKPRRLAFLVACISLAVAAAVLAYPPLVIPALIAVVGTMASSPRRVRSYLGVALVAAGVVSTLALLYCLRHTRWQDIDTTLELTRSTNKMGGLQKLLSMKAQVGRMLPPWRVSALLVAMIVLAASTRRGLWARLLCWQTAFIGLTIWFYFAHIADGGYQPVAWLLFLGGMVAPVGLALGILEKRLSKGLVLNVVVPSFAAAFIFGYTSGNGGANLGLGALPALLVAIACMLGGDEAQSPGSAWVPVGCWALLVFVLVSFQYAFIYEDQKWPAQTSRVKGGPFAGLWTTPAKAVYLDEIGALVAELERSKDAPGSKIIFYPNFPAGYLMTSLRPGVFASWVERSENLPEKYLSVFETHYRKSLIRMANTNTWVVELNHDWAFYQKLHPVLSTDRFFRLLAEWSPERFRETEIARVYRLPRGCSLASREDQHL